MRYAGFWIRVTAEVIDSTILAIASVVIELMIFGVAFWVIADPEDLQQLGNPVFTQLLNLVVYSVISIPYYTWWHYRNGTTPGKVKLKIHVVNAKDHGKITFQQALVRTLAYALSYIPLGAGFIMAGIHPEKRALHDLLAGTVSIIREPDAPKPSEAPSPAGDAT